MNGDHHDVHPVIELKKNTSDVQIDEMILVVDAMMTVMTDAATTLGSIAKRISLQSDFAADLRDTIERGLGRLVDADMDEASTRLKALETREQLALQALSIANSQPGDLLQLFQ
ncbi:Flagellin [compost metagenome]